MLNVKAVYQGSETGDIRVYGTACKPDADEPYVHWCPSIVDTGDHESVPLSAIEGTVNVQHNCVKDHCKVLRGKWVHRKDVHFILNVFCTKTPWLDRFVPKAPPLDMKMEMQHAWERLSALNTKRRVAKVKKAGRVVKKHHQSDGGSSEDDMESDELGEEMGGIESE